MNIIIRETKDHNQCIKKCLKQTIYAVTRLSLNLVFAVASEDHDVLGKWMKIMLFYTMTNFVLSYASRLFAKAQR